MERIFIFDTTLRDGEQAPGASMTLDQKLAVAKQLEILGVDRIDSESRFGTHSYVYRDQSHSYGIQVEKNTGRSVDNGG